MWFNISHFCFNTPNAIAVIDLAAVYLTKLLGVFRIPACPVVILNDA
jgi:hypothetical protein